jgi:hypothetical protein
MLRPVRRAGGRSEQLGLHVKQLLRRGGEGGDLVRRRIDETSRISPSLVEEVDAIEAGLFESGHNPLPDDQPHSQVRNWLPTGVARGRFENVGRLH